MLLSFGGVSSRAIDLSWPQVRPPIRDSKWFQLVNLIKAKVLEMGFVSLLWRRSEFNCIYVDIHGGSG